MFVPGCWPHACVSRRAANPLSRLRTSSKLPAHSTQHSTVAREQCEPRMSARIAPLEVRQAKKRASHRIAAIAIRCRPLLRAMRIASVGGKAESDLKPSSVCS